MCEICERFKQIGKDQFVCIDCGKMFDEESMVYEKVRLEEKLYGYT
jgi:hypothetical protein